MTVRHDDAQRQRVVPYAPKRRHHAAILVAGALLLLVSALACRAADKVRLGKAQAVSWIMIPADVGVEQGLFARNGLDVEIVDLAGDAKVQQALSSGSIEFGIGSGPGMAFAAKGSSGIAVAAFAGEPRHISAIVLENAPIKTVSDLKGKRIAVSTVGSLSDWLTKQMALREGWGANGVEAVPLGAINASVAALRAGQVDAVVLATETGYELEERHEGRIIVGMERYAPHFISEVIFAQKELVAKNAARVRRFLAGFFAAIDFIKANKEASSAIAQRVLHQSPMVASHTYDAQISMFNTDGTFDPEAVAALKRSFVEMGTLDKPPQDAALFTTEFVPAKR